MHLTDRDKNLLILLAKYYAINTDGLKKIYGKRYHEKRTAILRDNNYINKNWGICTLGSLGKKYLEDNIYKNKKLHFVNNRETAKRYAKACNIALNLSNWEMTISRTIKIKYHLNRGMRFQGIVKNSLGEKFALYDINKKTTKRTLQLIKAEISNLSSYGLDINKVIVIAHGPKIITDFGIEDFNLSKLFMLPSGDYAYKLLNLYGKLDLNEWSIEKIYGKKEIKKSPIKAFQYKVDNDLITNLILNDIASINYINMYNQLVQDNNTSKNYNLVVICLESQKEYFKKIIKGKVEYKTIQDSEILKIIE